MMSQVRANPIKNAAGKTEAEMDAFFRTYAGV
jgi:hypothetical protein